jgi:hypothetical protein
VFVVLGIGALIAGETALGVLTLAVFGGGSVVFLTPLLTRRGKSAVRIVDIGGEQAFLFPISRAKQSVAIFASLAFTVAGVLMVISGAVAIGILCGGVFGAFALIGLWGLRKPRGLALTPTRVIVDFNGVGRDRGRRDRQLHGAPSLSRDSRHLARARRAPRRMREAVLRYRDDPGRRRVIGTAQELALVM